MGQQGHHAQQALSIPQHTPCAARTQQRAAELEGAARALRGGKLHERNLAAVLRVAQNPDLGHRACGTGSARRDQSTAAVFQRLVCGGAGGRHGSSVKEAAAKAWLSQLCDALESQCIQNLCQADQQC